jgi:hypothetical protein
VWVWVEPGGSRKERREVSGSKVVDGESEGLREFL